MTKYVRLNQDRSEMTSAIFSNKPKNVARHSDEVLRGFGWFPVVERNPGLPDSELYRLQTKTWYIEDNAVVIEYEPVMISDNDQIVQVISTRIDNLRDEALRGGLVFAGKRFDTNRTTLLRVVGKWTSVVLNPSETVQWITEDNETVEMTNEQARLFGKAFESFEESNVLYARQLKTRVENSDDPMSIDIREGWPSNEFHMDIKLSLL